MPITGYFLLCEFVQIWETSPPMQDVPPGLPALVYSLIRAGWTVDKAKRPDAATLLQHKAFSLLGEFFIHYHYSVLCKYFQ